MAHPDLLGDYAKELWALSNTIAAFSVLQSLTFAYSLQKESFRKAVFQSTYVVKPAIVLCTFVYVVAITVIDGLQTSLVREISTELEHIVICVALLKLIAVILSGGGSLMLVCSTDPQRRIHKWFRK